MNKWILLYIFILLFFHGTQNLKMNPKFSTFVKYLPFMYVCMFVCMYVCVCVCVYIYIYRVWGVGGRSQWPRGLRVGLRPLVCRDYGLESQWHTDLQGLCVVKWGFCVGLITRPEECDVPECDLEASTMRRLNKAAELWKKNVSLCVCVCVLYFTKLFVMLSLILDLTTCFGRKYSCNYEANHSSSNTYNFIWTIYWRWPEYFRLTHVVSSCMRDTAVRSSVKDSLKQRFWHNFATVVLPAVFLYNFLDKKEASKNPEYCQRYRPNTITVH
jgi:hypothetical protein